MMVFENKCKIFIGKYHQIGIGFFLKNKKVWENKFPI